MSTIQQTAVRRILHQAIEESIELYKKRTEGKVNADEYTEMSFTILGTTAASIERIYDKD